VAGATGSRAGQTADATVDVVVPVYNAADDLARCVESVLLHTQHPYRLVLIDDASPDPAIAAFFDGLKRRALPHVLLLRNRRNRGFPATANRGMGLSRADAVLLNSDTIVTTGWLTALARCAASGPRIGTVTPFSNNAEICSFPRFCENNAPGDGDDAEAVRAALARAAVPTYPCLPTGVGFCFYIRRELIDAIGVFDLAFGPGYGEENDYCMRALAAGYRNVLCDDAYVLHLGGRSFVGQKSDLGVRNTALLLERHPRYAEIVRQFITGDPLRPLRDAALAQQRASTGARHGVLHVLQSLGGGTERQVRALVGASRARCRHYVATAAGDDWRIEEDLDDGAVRAFDFRRLPDESWPAFLGGIAATFRIDLVHLHNISGCRDGIIDALGGLGVPYGYTVHDLHFACPTITFLGADGMYCGAVTDAAACARCLGTRTRFAGIDIVAWRARHHDLVARSAFLVAPSRWAASMLARYFPGRTAEVIPHGLPQKAASAPDGERAPCAAFALPDDDIPTVAVLGAIGPDKGARRLERMVELVRATGTRVRFVLIGYLDVRHGPWRSDDAALTIHGQYDPTDLPRLLDHYRVKLVAYPSAGPETFSLTLSEAWSAGRPAIVPPFGALAERVGATGAGWL
jgi:GT2 family glycosyltransferase/glycosyltransferase involved in cell wall biosynthesis